MTDDTSDTPNGIETGIGEPSMEDILASIRRIIAEDDETEDAYLDIDGVVDGASLQSVQESTEKSTEEISASNADNTGTDWVDAVSETDSNDSENEDVLVLDQLVNEANAASALTDIETEELMIDGAGPQASEEEFNPVSSVVSDLENRLSEDPTDTNESDMSSTGDDEIDEILASLDSENLVFSANDAEKKPSGNVVSVFGDEDIDLLVDDEPELEVADKQGDAVSDAATNDDQELDTSFANEAESDLDIVKSLMADLADTSFMDDPIDEPNVNHYSADEESSPTDDAETDLEANIELGADDDVLNIQDAIMDEISAAEPEMEAAEPAETTMAETSIDEMLDLVLADEQDEITSDAVSDEDQILNDILELTIQDEEDSLVDLDLAVEEIVETEAPDGAETSSNPLLQIAAEAEADADAMDNDKLDNDKLDSDRSDSKAGAVITGAGAGIGAGVGALAAAGTALASGADTNEPGEMDLVLDEGPSTEDLLSELDLALAEVTQEDNQKEAVDDLEAALELELETEPETVVDAAAETTELFIEPEEAEDMPKAARKDAIINEVTEEASADAFAELSQAVEEKAVYTESGPRVGDIVQDALRPMLKEWLDENLKGIVERAVAKEVKRISSGK